MEVTVVPHGCSWSRVRPSSSIGNPKTWAVALSAAAGYSGVASDRSGLVLILTVVFAAVVFPNLLAWAALGRVLSRHLRTPRRWRVFSVVLAVLLALSVAAIWL